MSVFVIAECGSTHDGDFVKALRLVNAAYECGCQVAKFQYWSDADALADRRKVPERYREIYRRYRVPAVWLYPLASYCERLGIDFMATCYLPADVDTVAPFVKRFKISSFEAGDAELARAHVPFLPSGQNDNKRELFISLGMNTDPNVVLRALDGCYWWSAVKLLHCVSSYPAPIDAMHLALLRPPYGHDDDSTNYDGLSDHSRNILIGALAVAAGAEIIEAHLRLDDTDPENPDFATAFTPSEFAEYVRNIRFAERVMGTGEKALQDCEREMARYRVGGTT